jgi:HlyD family secretion protein
MRKWQLFSIMVVLILIGTTACSFPGASGANGNTVIVKKGDLTVSINGSGNIATYQDRNLSFGSAGKIAAVSVKEGDRVKKGDVLAKLETDTLELAETEARINVSKADAAAAQAGLVISQESTTAGKARLAVNQADADVKTAEYNLKQVQDLFILQNVSLAKSDMDEAKRDLDDALEKLTHTTVGTPGYATWQSIIVHANARYAEAKDRFDAMTAGSDPMEVAIKKQQLEIAQQSLDVAKQVVAAELSTQAYNEQSATVAEQNLEFAQQSQKLAQKRLADAVITAPFDGVVADVKIKAGDLVDGTTTAVYIVKPTLLEVVVEVDEMDIPKVTAGQTVKLTVDALPGKENTGAVTAVYPVPAKVTGLVMYDVKISLTAPEDSGLKIGMRTTASIIIDKKSNIIKLPNKAVKDDGKGGHFVKVVVGKNTENRQVTTGLNNGTETEISSGLNVGETVVN